MEVIEQDPTTGDRVFRFMKGPVFANILLADEINRGPRKTHVALLEAMPERRVNHGGSTTRRVFEFRVQTFEGKGAADWRGQARPPRRICDRRRVTSRGTGGRIGVRPEA